MNEDRQLLGPLSMELLKGRHKMTPGHRRYLDKKVDDLFMLDKKSQLREEIESILAEQAEASKDAYLDRKREDDEVRTELLVLTGQRDVAAILSARPEIGEEE